MDSFTLYRSYFNRHQLQRFSHEKNLLMISEVVDAVFNELNSFPFELQNSPFITETAKIINRMKTYTGQIWKGRLVAIIDAVGVIGGVKNRFYVQGYNFFADAEMISSYEKHFFDDARYQGESQFIELIEQDLNQIQRALMNLQASSVVFEQGDIQVAVEVQSTPTKIIQSPPNAPPVSIPAKSSDVQDFSTKATASPAQSPARPSGQQDFSTRQTASPVQSSARPSGQQDFNARATASPAQSPAQSSVMQDYAAKTNAQIEFQKYIAETEAERTKQLKARREDNAPKIEEWHKGQTELTERVRELQYPAQKLLEDFRSFSTTLTENYIVQFAKTQIELFNLITDNYAWHSSRAETSQSKDYYKAVDNYRSYLELIVDALADFGIEEILSDPKTRFDGKIHDVKNTKNFYPQTATIKKSLRSGFRYGELILQKEEVEV